MLISLFSFVLQAHSKAEKQVRFVFLQRIETSYKLIALDVRCETLTLVLLLTVQGKRTWNKFQVALRESEGLFGSLCFIWQLLKKFRNLNSLWSQTENSSLGMGDPLIKRKGVLVQNFENHL